jgi:hypothetical protein
MKKSLNSFLRRRAKTDRGIDFRRCDLESREAIAEEKNGLEVCVRMGGAVVYSHEKQKNDCRFFATDFYFGTTGER